MPSKRKQAAAKGAAASSQNGAPTVAKATRGDITTFAGMVNVLASCVDDLAQGSLEVNRGNAIFNGCGKIMRLAEMKQRAEQLGASRAKGTKLIDA